MHLHDALASAVSVPAHQPHQGADDVVETAPKLRLDPGQVAECVGNLEARQRFAQRTAPRLLAHSRLLVAALRDVMEA